MTVINTNVASLNAQAALASNARGLSKAMEQLSTGRRINSASDDAAGLAVSTRLTSQIRGLNTAVRNANDAISMIQTAEGAAVEITNMLQRMRELAVQSANDTNTSTDRDFLNLEFQQLKEEINRIGNTTQWNGMNILNGATNSGTFTYQVGANANQTVSITIGNFTSTDSQGTATAATAYSDPDQTSTVTLAGTFAAGDVITLTANGKQAQYTVQEDDIDATTPATTLDNIATSIVADTDIASTLGVTVGNAGTATFDVGGTGDGTFSFSVGVASGDLAAIDAIEITTRDLSNSAISSIDGALTTINEQRATMGAVVNRLQYTVDNLTNVSTKAAESRSRVLDTDYSQATTELSKRQIISQAATAMLAQANQQPQTVLSLLK